MFYNEFNNIDNMSSSDVSEEALSAGSFGMNRKSSSRVARNDIFIPSKVSFELKDNKCKLSNGTNSTELVVPNGVEIVYEGSKVRIIESDVKYKSNAGTLASNLKNACIGLSSGFEKKLIMKGVGYRAVLSGNKLELNVGKSHKDIYEIADNVNIKCPTPTEIVISGYDKSLVSSVAAKIVRFRQYEPYGGKGILYSDKKYTRKEVKK